MHSKPDKPRERRSTRWIGPLCVLGSAVGFSAKAIFVKLVYPYGVDAITVLALRMLLALPFFLVLACWPRPGEEHPSRLRNRDWLAVAGLGLIGYYLSSLLDFYGLFYISAGLERLILFLYPTLVLVISAAVLRQSVSRRQWTALAFSYAGIGLAFVHDLSLGRQEQVLLGGALVFGAALTYAVYILGSSRYIRRLGVSRFTGVAMISATAGVLTHFAQAKPWSDLQQPQAVMLPIVLMALLGTVMPSIFLSEGLRRIGPARTALLSSIGPVVTIGLGHAVLGEPVSLQQLAGAALVMAGVGLVTVAKR
ncbi:DMT family transporter [Methylogaea oryzae]|uniref:Permease n=1 Tax=Methylogaea oryzae TaxID=1295382 RepID=A0A8D5ALT1_9GAMM|nr:DMT family transporter [Methylogaea oryzae]BBL72451.1 permease [Methylogaea oryzae]